MMQVFISTSDFKLHKCTARLAEHSLYIREVIVTGKEYGIKRLHIPVPCKSNVVLKIRFWASKYKYSGLKLEDADDTVHAVLTDEEKKYANRFDDEQIFKTTTIISKFLAMPDLMRLLKKMQLIRELDRFYVNEILPLVQARQRNLENGANNAIAFALAEAPALDPVPAPAAQMPASAELESPPAEPVPPPAEPVAAPGEPVAAPAASVAAPAASVAAPVEPVAAPGEPVAAQAALVAAPALAQIENSAQGPALAQVLVSAPALAQVPASAEVPAASAQSNESAAEPEELPPAEPL